MLDLVLTCGVDISDLVVSPYTSALSDHSLLTFQVVVSCPCDDHQAAFSCRRITPATTSAMADKLPLSLAPLCNCRGSVECLADELSNVWSAAIDPVEKTAPWFNVETRTLKDPEDVESLNAKGTRLNLWSFVLRGITVCSPIRMH